MAYLASGRGTKAMAYQAGVTFPGISQVVEFSGTLSHGITPSVFSLTIVPQASTISTQGSLVLSWTDGTTLQTLTFVHCVVDKASMQYDPSGALVSLAVLDRRWKWRYGYICGRYNLRGADGEIVKAAIPLNGDAGEDTERTLQQLATLCLDAMGEVGYDVSDLPAGPRPKVEWDYIAPAEALAELVEDVGYRVVLQLDGTVAIRQAGDGAALPAGAKMSISTEIDPPERPDYISVVTGRTRFQFDLPLKAVGLDVDGKIKPIEELSYTPAGGWVLSDTTEHLDLGDEEKAELAKQSVFRWYQIEVASIALPVIASDLSRRWLIEDLTDEQNSVVVEDGAKRPQQAWIYGVWYRERDREAGNVGFGANPTPITGVDDPQVVDRSWSYDQKRKIIKFGQPIFKVNANDLIEKPALRARVAFFAADPETRCWHRVVRTRDKTGDWGTNGTNELVIHQEHIVPKYTASFLGGYLPANTAWNSNITDVNAICDEYIDQEVAILENQASQAMTYAGLVIAGVELDGAITQIDWRITTREINTRIYRNTDPGSRTTISYDERRINEKNRLNAEEVERMRKQGATGKSDSMSPGDRF